MSFVLISRNTIAENITERGVILSSQSNETNFPADTEFLSSPAISSANVELSILKKVCHAEIILDKTIVNLTTEIQKLKDIMSMNIISNPEETRNSIKTKETELKKAVKQKDTLIRNRINKRASRKKKKEEFKEMSLKQTGISTTPAIGRPKSVDEDALIAAITILHLQEVLQMIEEDPS